MAWNDALGEGIQPKQPQIFERMPPRYKPLTVTKSCPAIPDADDECKLADQQGYVLWDDLFKSMVPDIDAVSTHPQSSATAAALKRMAELALEKSPHEKSHGKAHSMNDIRVHSIGNNEVHQDAGFKDFEKNAGNLNDLEVHAGKSHNGIATIVHKVCVKEARR